MDARRALRGPRVDPLSDKPWKQHERDTAKLIGGARYWANSGESVDVESGAFVVQCKLVKTCSLAALETLALEAERQGHQKAKIGMVAIRRRAGRGRPTPRLIVLTESAFREMSGPVPP